VTRLPVPSGPTTGLLHHDQTYVPPRTWRTWLIGRHLATADAPHQTIGRLVGLAVFSSDAMSSVAYGPQEMMLVLAMAGAAGLAWSFPIAVAIVGLLLILTVSYEQTIHAYPGGGGAYIVARDNLGELPAQTAGAALLTDYILTVAVSVSSGIAQVTSAVPGLYPYRVVLAVAAVIVIMVINLRGVRESGAVFAVPTYFFIGMAFITVGLGLFRYLGGSLGSVVAPPPHEAAYATGALTLFLVLRAFASGTTALTGVEAISNGITAFKEPRSSNAGATLIYMSAILGSLMLAITFLAHQIGAVPSEAETIISQIARTVFMGRGPAYLAMMASTTLILVMAANTAFADFPRLAALHAGDGFLPRQLTFRGSRLVFSRGIVALGLVASLLIVVFQASVTALIPLYAIGVFLSFTLSQSGMARRWWKSGHLGPDETLTEPGSVLRHDPRWRPKLVVNATGAVCTAVVAVVFAVTKFRDGAWIVLLLTPVMVYVFFAIHRHYRNLSRNLTLEEYAAPPRRRRRHRVLVPISGVHRGTLEALDYARSLSDDVTGVHVSIDPSESERVMAKWDAWGDGTRLVVIDSPYRVLLEPLLAYINGVLANRQPGEVLTVVVPQFVPERRLANLLHMQTAFFLRAALLGRRGVVITEVPYHIEPGGLKGGAPEGTSATTDA
jgi:amino acid transporter